MFQLRPRFNPFVQAMGGGAAVWIALMGGSPVAAQDLAPTFSDLCASYQGEGDSWGDIYSRPYAWETMGALLAAVDTENCGVAQQRLTAVTDIRGPQLQTTGQPDGALMVDFPIAVDVQTVAIATPNLTSLNLSGRVIEDLTPIAMLGKLQTLRLAHTQLDDISPLSGLTQLTTLDVSYNQIDSIAPVTDLLFIRSLNVAYNPFTDISPIGEILTPYTESEWQLLDLSGIEVDRSTCPVNLGDICEGPLEDNG